ncbi:MAG: MarR family transcriptional regulator [Flavobacteriaceae bacterium]|nr:MarR family transcriptional regulator [Flavobacteriaceae bacterium]
MDSSKGFGHYLDRTVKRIQLAYQKAFKEKNIDMTIEQWVILQQIYELGPSASQRELTNLNFRTRATTSKMITNLVDKGYITKSLFDGDLKRYKLELTEKGQHIIETILPFIKELRAIGYKDIDQDDFRVFLKVLDQIWHNYEKVDV